MSGPKATTVKRLFALSGNVCAFPGCTILLASTGNLAGHICHIKGARPGAKRYDPSQTDEERHDLANLMLMCPTHHQVIDSNDSIFSVAALTQVKAAHEQRMSPQLHSASAEVIQHRQKKMLSGVSNHNGNVAIGSPGAHQTTNLTIKAGSKKVSINAPPGTIGADGLHAAYIAHMIKRYNEYASAEPSRSRAFSYGAISSTIESKLGAPWKLLPLARAPEVISYLMLRIERTRQGRIVKSKGIHPVSTLTEFSVRWRAENHTTSSM